MNAIAPGFVDTDMTRALESQVRQMFEGIIPLCRKAEATEIAQTAEFLAAGPDYVTGAFLVIDGGWSLA